MGQCWVKLGASGDLAVASVTESYREGTSYRLRHSDGPLSNEEKAIEEILGPLFRLALEARFGRQLCLHVFTSLTRVARLCLEEHPEGPSVEARLARLRETAWEFEELLDNFSSRGWLLRLLCTTRLDAVVKWRLGDLAGLEAELASVVQGQKVSSKGITPLAPAESFLTANEGKKRLAAGLRHARRLREALLSHLPSVMAPHGAAGDPTAMDAFMRRITPLVQGGGEPLRQLELHEEVQIAVASLSVGPHRALRHPDLQYFWWRHMAGLEEVPWSTLWPHLATFLGNTPRLSDGAGDTGAALELLRSPDMVRLLQAAVHRMGYANYVNAVELDMAFGSGTGSRDCTTLDEHLRFLVSPGRPLLLARTSKGARAEGWIKEAEAAAAAGKSGASAVAYGDGSSVTRRGPTAHAAGLGDEEDVWFDAGSNFSRSNNSSCFKSALAAGEDPSGTRPGRMNSSRHVSQAVLAAGFEETPRNGPDGSLAPNAAYTAGMGTGLLECRLVSRWPSLQPLRHRTATGRDSARDAKEFEAKPPGANGSGGYNASTTTAATIAAADVVATAPDTGVRAIDVGGTEGSRDALPLEATAPEPESPLSDQKSQETGEQQTGQQQQLGQEHTEPQQLDQQPIQQRRSRYSSAVGRAVAGMAAPQWPAAPGLARLIGRNDDLNRISQGILACRAGGDSLTPRPLSTEAITTAAPSPSAATTTTPAPTVLLVSGPLGCGRTALVTAVADRLVASGEWTCAAFADVRCAAGPEDAALEMALALNVPFYATDRPAVLRLLSWLRTYGPQLRQGLVLDNVDLLMGIGRDEALEVARGTGTASAPPALSSSACNLQSACWPSQPATATVAHGPQPDQEEARGSPSLPAAEAEDRRRRVLRLLREVALAAPGLQVVMISGPEVTSELLQPCIPQDLSIRYQSLELMSHLAARQLLRSALGLSDEMTDSGDRSNSDGRSDSGDSSDSAALLETKMETITQASNCLPGLLRMVARAVRCDVHDLATLASWATEALRCAAGKSDVAAAAFTARLLSHSLARLPTDARAVLNCMVNLGCPLEEEDITAAAAFLGHPGIVRAGLCCLYDRGLLTFQDLNQRHDVVGHVQTWMHQCCGFMLGPAMHGASMAGAPAAGVGAQGSGARSSRSAPGTAVSAPGSNVGGTVLSSLRSGHESGVGSGAGGHGRAASEAGGGRRSTGTGHGGRRRTVGGPNGSTGGRGLSGGNAERHSGLMRDKGIRLSVLVQHLDALLSQVSELYSHGCRVAALRLYNNGRALADRALLLVPAWISRASPSSATAAFFAAVMNRHLNGICRHVLLPSQLVRVSTDLAAMVAWLPSPYERLIAYVTVVRAHVHLAALEPASQHLASADLLAQQLYPTLAAHIEANKSATQTRAKSTGGAGSGGNGSEDTAVTPMGDTSAGAGALGVAGPGPMTQTKEKGGLTRTPPQVAQLVLAHAELAAAQKQYGAAARYLEAFLEFLAASGMAHSLEAAQARMQLGDLCLRRNRPPAEAAAQYEMATTALTQLYGQSHFRVGRAMLAAARCSPDNQHQQQHPGLNGPQAAKLPPPDDAAAATTGGNSSGRSSRRTTGVSPAKSYRSLETQLKDCLHVQHLSQGKFNLDVAEVEVARGFMFCRRGKPDEALSCGLVALGVVLEILGDGTPQVTECLVLVALALRQKSKSAAAAAIMQHAHVVRLHAAAMTAAAGCDVDTAVARPRPTHDVVLENLIDAVTPQLPPTPRSPTAVAVVADACSSEQPTVQGSAGSGATKPKGQGRSPRSPRTRGQRMPRRSAALLQRSPIVQVPLPGGQDDDGMGTPPPTGRTSDDPASLLMPSPMLVVLAPGDEDFAVDDPAVVRSAGGIPYSPSSPSVQLGFSARMAAAAAVADADTHDGGLVHHVSYPPPLAPLDSAPVGFNELSPSPSPRAATLGLKEWSPRGTMALTPSHRGRGDGGEVPATAVAMTSSPSAGSEATVAVAAPAVPEASLATLNSPLAASPERKATGDLKFIEPRQQPTVGEGKVDDAVRPGTDTSFFSPAVDAASTFPSEVWTDTPDNPIDAIGIEVRLRRSGPQSLTAATEMVAPERFAAVATTERSPASEPSPAMDTTRTTTMVAEEPEDGSLSARTDTSGAGMHLPFPPPEVAAASSTGCGTPTNTGPWCTPARVRPVQPMLPQLHPSPLTGPPQRYTATGNSDASDSPQAFSPGLSLPQPPMLTTAGPSVAASGSFDATATITAAAAAVAAVGVGVAESASPTITCAAGATSDDTPGSGMPDVRLSWSAYSPTAERLGQDTRALRGGIVFPTPSTTPGPSVLGQRAPWLSWATSGAADTSQDTPHPRALRFSETIDVSGRRFATASSVLMGSATSGGTVGFTTATATVESYSLQETPDGVLTAIIAAGGGEFPAGWTVAAAAAAAATLSAAHSRVTTTRTSVQQQREQEEGVDELDGRPEDIERKVKESVHEQADERLHAGAADLAGLQDSASAVSTQAFSAQTLQRDNHNGRDMAAVQIGLPALAAATAAVAGAVQGTGERRLPGRAEVIAVGGSHDNNIRRKNTAHRNLHPLLNVVCSATATTATAAATGPVQAVLSESGNRSSVDPVRPPDAVAAVHAVAAASTAASPTAPPASAVAVSTEAAELGSPFETLAGSSCAAFALHGAERWHGPGTPYAAVSTPVARAVADPAPPCGMAGPHLATSITTTGVPAIMEARHDCDASGGEGSRQARETGEGGQNGGVAEAARAAGTVASNMESNSESPEPQLTLNMPPLGLMLLSLSSAPLQAVLSKGPGSRAVRLRGSEGGVCAGAGLGTVRERSAGGTAVQKEASSETLLEQESVAKMPPLGWTLPSLGSGTLYRKSTNGLSTAAGKEGAATAQAAVAAAADGARNVYGGRRGASESGAGAPLAKTAALLEGASWGLRDGSCELVEYGSVVSELGLMPFAAAAGLESAAGRMSASPVRRSGLFLPPKLVLSGSQAKAAVSKGQSGPATAPAPTLSVPFSPTKTAAPVSHKGRTGLGMALTSTQSFPPPTQAAAPVSPERRKGRVTATVPERFIPPPMKAAAPVSPKERKSLVRASTATRSVPPSPTRAGAAVSPKRHTGLVTVPTSLRSVPPSPSRTTAPLSPQGRTSRATAATTAAVATPSTSAYPRKPVGPGSPKRRWTVSEAVPVSSVLQGGIRPVLQHSTLTQSSLSRGPAVDWDPKTPVVLVRKADTEVAAVFALSTSIGRPQGTVAGRIPLPPSSTGANRRSNRSSSRIPTPPESESSGAIATATTASTPTAPPRPPLQRRATVVGSTPTATALGGSAVPIGQVSSTAPSGHGKHDPAAAAAWTLYSSPAYGMQDTINSPPRVDADVTDMHDGVVSSPAARYAGSYTAVYLMRAKAKSAAMSALGVGISNTDGGGGASGNSGANIMKQSSVDVGMLAASATATGNPCDPRDGVKMHNPLFVGHRTRSLGEATGSSCGFEQDDEDIGLNSHSGDALGSTPACNGGMRGGGGDGGGRRGVGISVGGRGGTGRHVSFRGRSSVSCGMGGASNRGGLSSIASGMARVSSINSRRIRVSSARGPSYSARPSRVGTGMVGISSRGGYSGSNSRVADVGGRSSGRGRTVGAPSGGTAGVSNNAGRGSRVSGVGGGSYAARRSSNASGVTGAGGSGVRRRSNGNGTSARSDGAGGHGSSYAGSTGGASDGVGRRRSSYAGSTGGASDGVGRRRSSYAGSAGGASDGAEGRRSSYAGSTGGASDGVGRRRSSYAGSASAGSGGRAKLTQPDGGNISRRSRMTTYSGIHSRIAVASTTTTAATAATAAAAGRRAQQPPLPPRGPNPRPESNGQAGSLSKGASMGAGRGRSSYATSRSSSMGRGRGNTGSGRGSAGVPY